MSFPYLFQKTYHFSVTGYVRLTKTAIKSLHFFFNRRAIPGVVDPNVKVRFV